MSNYLRAAEAIRDTFQCVVIIVHHCGLDETRPRGTRPCPEQSMHSCPSSGRVSASR